MTGTPNTNRRTTHNRVTDALMNEKRLCLRDRVEALKLSDGFENSTQSNQHTPKPVSLSPSVGEIMSYWRVNPYGDFDD